LPSETNRGARPARNLIGLVTAVIVVAFIVTAALISNGVRLLGDQDRARAWELHTYDVLLTSKDLMSAITDAQTGERGFLIAKDPRYLEPFEAGQMTASALIDRLARLTSDNPRQTPRIPILRDDVDAYMAALRDDVAAAKAGDAASAARALETGDDRRRMDDIRSRIGDFTAEEERLLRLRDAHSRADARAARAAIYWLSIAGALLLLFAAAAAILAVRAAARLRLASVESKAADDLERARDFLLAVVDGAADPIYVKDRDGRFVLANLETAKIYGVDRDSMIGKRDADYATPEVTRALEATDRRIMETGQAEVVEEQVHKDGELRTYQSSKAPWRRRDEVLGLIGVSQDITERKAAERALRNLAAELESRVEARTREIEKAEAQIRQMQKIDAIGQMTGGIAHDFNNMLAVVIGSLDIAHRRIDDDPVRARRFIDNAREGAARAATLTSRLLAFSRQQPLAPESLDLNKLVANMSELLRRTLGEHVQIETVLAGGLWRTMADPGEVENALLNLCVNARDAMPDGGRLTIETANAHLDETYAADHLEVAVGQYVLICVSDTGSGMPPEVIERAFDPFYTTKPVGKGTGLGLSQVYGFIKQSGGHVKIYSEIGHGTTLKVYLPRWFGAEVSRAAGAQRDGQTARGAATEIVLVVEDEAGVRNISVDALRELGYTVIHAENASEALRMIEGHPKIDLLFTDIVMPEMNGRQLADRAVALRPSLKVLYTTGYTRNAVVHNGVLDPGVAFLPKPFTIDQLATKVRQVLDG
jgi:PAS domain S-box-containing protein